MPKPSKFRKWKIGTLVTGRLVTSDYTLYVRWGCQHHVFQITTKAERYDHTPSGYRQGARCLVCDFATKVDIEWWQERPERHQLETALKDVRRHRRRLRKSEEILRNKLTLQKGSG